jgi:adenylate cyclase
MSAHSFKDFIFDSSTGAVMRGGNCIFLRPKTAQVLTYMIENQGRLLTKNELLDKIWTNVEVSEDSLTQCVSEIRTALSDDDRCLLKTLPRRGYIFSTFPPQLKGSLSCGAGRLIERRASRPVLAVLPLDNLNQDGSGGHIASGIAEDIIVEISRLREIAVVARASSFRYRRKNLGVQRIGRALGAGYLLDGSIRTEGRRLRLTVNLVDIKHGTLIWAESFDRGLMEVFAIQTELARTVASYLVAHVARTEFEKTRLKPPSVWHAYDHYLNANESMHQYWATLDASSVYESRRLLEQSIGDDPRYGRSYALLAHTYTTAAVNALDDDYLKPTTLEKAETLARKSVGLDPGLAQAHAYLGMILMFRRKFDDAVAETELALDLNPSYSDWRIATVFGLACQFEKGAAAARAHMELNPFYVNMAPGWLGACLHMLQRYEEALVPLLKSVALAPNMRFPRIWLAGTYARLGRLEEAREQVQRVLHIEPAYTIDTARKLITMRDEAHLEHILQSLRMAGVPLR